MRRQLDTDDSRTVVKRWAALWSAEEVGGTDKVFAPNLHDHRPPPFHDLKGIDEETQFIAKVRSAFPDLQVTIEDMVVDEDRVAARVLHCGTHRGDFLGIAPTGRAVIYEGTVIFGIVNGRINERWGTVDLFGILSQLGVEPAAKRGRVESALEMVGSTWTLMERVKCGIYQVLVAAINDRKITLNPPLTESLHEL